METNIVNPMHAKQRSKKQELISIHGTDDLKEAEKMEEEGQLYEEDGSCLVRLCRCCCTDILSDEEEEKEKKVHVKNERGVKKTKILKSVNSWITLPIVESK